MGLRGVREAVDLELEASRNVRSGIPGSEEIPSDHVAIVLLALDNLALLKDVPEGVTPVRWRELVYAARREALDSVVRDSHLTVRQVAEELGMGAADVRGLVDRGELKAARSPDGKTSVSRLALDAYRRRLGGDLPDTERPTAG